MGYSTFYLKSFAFDRKIDQGHADILVQFSQTVHENSAGKPGGDGKPPTFLCQWIPTPDRTGLEWDKNEKFYYGKEWLEHLIERYIAPWGYQLNGESPWYIDAFDDAGILKVSNNVVTQESRDIGDIKAEYGEFGC